MKHVCTAGALCVVALWLVACGGGGAGDAIPTEEVGEGGGIVEPSNLVVIRYDRNGDGLPDILTFDTSVSPFRIVEALEGTPDGGAADASDRLAGEPIPGEIGTALANHLATSYSLGRETDLEVNMNDQSVSVTVVE